MIWKAVADEDLMKVATEAARKLAAGPTSAIAILKKVVAQAEHNSCLEQLEVETQYQPSLLGSEDCSEAISAFFDKRLPVFKEKIATLGRRK